MSDNDALGNRMKEYEHATRYVLPRRMPVIIRVDGIAWHTFTREAKRPFDDVFGDLTIGTMLHLCENIQGAVFGYTQSDEISLLLHNYKHLATEPWLGNGVQKIASHAASMASSFASLKCGKPCIFDARVWILSEAEVCNYFLWRQQDCTRNAISQAARSVFSQKEVAGKNGSEMQEMLLSRGINFQDYPRRYRQGCAAQREYAASHRWVADMSTPIFSQSRNYIERHLAIEPEE